MMVLLNAKELSARINRHEGSTSNQCQQCETEFNGNELLDIRRRICNADHLFWCAVCGSSFANKSHLQKHIVGHMAKNPHYKDVKPLLTSSTNPYSPSMKFQPSKNSACRVAKSLAAREALSLSANVESTRSKKPHVVDEDFLRKHVKFYEQHTHSPEEPMYTCHTCNEDFADLFKLKLHIVRSHLGATPYKCLEVGCEASFANQATLRKHMSVVHSDIIPYKCKQCFSKFKFLSDLLKHVRRHHPHNERYTHDVSRAAPLKEPVNDSVTKKNASGNGWKECCEERLGNGLSVDAKNEHIECMDEHKSELTKQQRSKTGLTISPNPKGTDSKLDSQNPINESQPDISTFAGPKCVPEITMTDLLIIDGFEGFISDDMNEEFRPLHRSNSEEALGTTPQLHICTEPLSAVYGKTQLPFLRKACISESEKGRILQAQFDCSLESNETTRNSSSVQKDETKSSYGNKVFGLNRLRNTPHIQDSDSVKVNEHICGQSKSNKLKLSNDLQWGQGPIIINARQGHKHIPYQCKLCNVDFYFCRQLLSHIKRVHDSNRRNFFSKPDRRKQTSITNVLYRCKQCNIQYKQHSMYVRHLREIHGKNGPFPENAPRTAVQNKSSLRRTTSKIKTRKKTHYQCTKCDAKFKRCRELLLHMTQSHEVSMKEIGTQTVLEQQNVSNNIITLAKLEGTNYQTEESHEVNDATTYVEVEKQTPCIEDADLEVQQLFRKRHKKHRQITDSPKRKKLRKTRNTLKICKSDATKMGFNEQYSTEGEKVVNSYSAEACDPAWKQLYGIRENAKCSATGYGDANKTHQCKVCKTKFKHCHEFVNHDKCIQKIWESELPVTTRQPTKRDEYHIHTECDFGNNEQSQLKPSVRSSKLCGRPNKTLGKPHKSNSLVQNQAEITAHIKKIPTVKENHYLCQCCNTDFKQMNELLKHFLRRHYRLKGSVSFTNGNSALRQPFVTKVTKSDDKHNLWMSEQSSSDYRRWCEMMNNAAKKNTEGTDKLSKYCRGNSLSEKIDTLEDTDHVDKVLYRCEECNAKFNQIDTLLKHRLIHASWKDTVV